MTLRLNDDLRSTINPRTRSLFLMGALIVGIILRWLNLTGKPLWMDEVITALFSFGQTYDDIPVERAMTVSALVRFFVFRPEATCSEIAGNVMTQSVHPPLFFCGLHTWLFWLQSIDGLSWVWKLRAFSAVMGVGAISLSYGITRLAFRSPNAAIFAAWVMAVSPFAVYLSQEARHYTLPMLLVMLGLLGLLKIQQDWQIGQINPLVWVGWAACQTLGFYTHYFFLLATVAQVGALLLWQWRWSRSGLLGPAAPRLMASNPWVPVAFTMSAIGFTYVPWLPIFLSHISRPETNWMKPFVPNFLTALAPFWQLPLGWLSMIVAFPVENQPIWILVPTAIAMVLFGFWIVQQVWIGFGKLWKNPPVNQSTFLLTGFLAIVIVEFLAIIFLLQKDITQVPRYNFIYYPAVCVLLAASLYAKEKETKTEIVARPTFYLILMGVLSSLFINANLAFQKPFQPEQIAANIVTGPQKTLVVMGYNDYQELALGLSFVLSLKQVNPQTKFAFLNRSMGYDQVIQKFPTLPNVDDFWLIAPGLRKRDFPNLTLVGQKTCRLSVDRYYRVGIPYQGYRCD